MRFSNKIAFFGVSVLALSVPALAQDKSAKADTGPKVAKSDTSSEIIVVTARRRQESKQDVPLVVNVVSAKELSNNNIRDFKDIANVVAGLQLTPNANGIGAQSSIRGVNHDVNVSGNNGTIQYYIDDAPAGSDNVFQSMYDLSQIEVERGPVGTLRGRAAPSGAIALTTHQPNLNEVGAYVDGTVGSAGLANVNFGIGVPIWQDKLAVRVAGVYDFNRGDRVYSVNNPTPPQNKTTSLRATVRFEPTDWLKAGFTFQTLHHENIGYDQVQSFGITDSSVPTSAGAPNYGTISLSDREAVEFIPRDSVQDQKRYSWHVQANFAGQSLYYIGSHEDDSYNVLTPNDTSGYFPSLTNTQNTQTLSPIDTHEIRLQNQTRIAGIFDYVAGYFTTTGDPTTSLQTGSLLQYTGAAVVGGNIIPLFALGGPSVTVSNINLPRTQTKEESFFGNVSAHLGNKAEISAGLRNVKNTDPGQNLYVNCADPTFATCTPTSPATPNNFNKTIYSVSARYHFTRDLMVYVSSGSSVRPGAHAIGDFSAAPGGFSPNEQAHTVTAPETSKNYEIGFKSNWMDRKVTFNLTYYHQDFTNYPFRAAGSGIYYLNWASPTSAPTVSSFNFISAVPVKVDGVEAEIDLKPSHNLFFNSTINYANGKIGNASIACNLVAGVPTVAQLQAAFAAAGTPNEHLGVCNGGGQASSYQPKWSGTIESEYSLPVGGSVEGFLRGLVSWRGPTDNDPSNPYDNINGYALFNGYIGIREPHGAWSLTLYGKNLANVTKLVTLNDTPANLSSTAIYLAPPTFRNFLGTGTGPTFTSQYGLVTVTPPREFGINLRIALGSR